MCVAVVGVFVPRTVESMCEVTREVRDENRVEEAVEKLSLLHVRYRMQE